jgi:hypothetical protein
MIDTNDYNTFTRNCRVQDEKPLLIGNPMGASKPQTLTIYIASVGLMQQFWVTTYDTSSGLDSQWKTYILC